MTADSASEKLATRRDPSADWTPTDLERLQRLVGPATPAQLRHVESFLGRSMAVFVPVLGPCRYALEPRHVHPGYLALVSRDFLRLPGFSEDPGPSGFQLRILPPLEPHQETLRPEPPRYYAIVLEAEWFDDVLAGYGIPGRAFRWEPHAAPPRLLSLLRDFLREAANRSGDDVLDALSLLVAHEIARSTLPSSRPSPGGTPSLQAAIDLMELRFSESIDLDRLARTACMSQSTFLRRFREAVGESPLQYLQGIRVQRARKLLRTGESVAATARCTGFSSPSHLAQAFRKRTGLTPLQYRRQVLAAK